MKKEDGIKCSEWWIKTQVSAQRTFMCCVKTFKLLITSLVDFFVWKFGFGFCLNDSIGKLLGEELPQLVKHLKCTSAEESLRFKILANILFPTSRCRFFKNKTWKSFFCRTWHSALQLCLWDWTDSLKEYQQWASSTHTWVEAAVPTRVGCWAAWWHFSTRFRY